MGISFVKSVQSISTSFLDDFFKFISKFGEYIPAMVFFILLYWCYNEKSAIKYLFIFASGIGINEVLKKMIKRPRPYIASDLITDKYSSKGFSMPSGHTMSAVLSFGGAFYQTRKTNKKWQNTVLLLLSVFVVLLVMFSRIYLGQHYFSDTIVAVLLGIVWIFLADKIFNLVGNKEHQIMFLAIPLSVIFLAFFGNPFVINSALEIYYIVSGVACGLLFGYYIDKTCVKREQTKNVLINLLQILIGSAICALTYFLIELIPNILFFSYLKYFAFGVVATLLCSYVFKKLNQAFNKRGSKN